MDVVQKTIVVAEDEALVRMLAVDTLVEAGFNVVEAANAAEAVTVLQAHSGDVALLFTDVHMPGEVTGMELVSLVRKQWPRVAILVTSGQYKPLAGELPINGRFVTKPYRLEHIIAHIQALTV